MTIALDKVKAAAAQGTVLTFGGVEVSASGSDRILIATIGVFKTGGVTTISSVTYGGIAMSQVTSGTVASGTIRSSIYYLINPTAGAADIVVTLAATAGCYLVASSWVGVHQTTPLGTYASATDTSAAPTVTVTSATDEVVVDALMTIGAGTLTVGSGQTVIATQFSVFGSSQEPGATSVAMAWTIASQLWVTGGVPLKPSTTTSPPITGAVTVSSGELRIVPLRGAPWGFSKWQDPTARNTLIDGDLATGWNVSGAGTSVTRISDATAPGGYYLQFVGTTTVPYPHSDSVTHVATVSDYVEYTVLAWVRPASGRSVYLRFWNDIAAFGPVVESAVGDGVTWQHLKNTITVNYSIGVAIYNTGGTTTFDVSGVELYSSPAMTENNAAALEASGQYPKVLAGTIQPDGEIIWDDIYTLPSVAPAGLIEVSAMPTRNSPHGSLIVTTQDKIAVYPLPFGPEPGDDPILATSRSDASASTDLVPVFYPAAIDFGTALYELLGVQCIGQDFIDEEDSWAMSYCWGTTAEWEVVRRLAQSHAVFYPAGRSIGSYLRTAVSIYDAADTDPVGPSGRHIICWVRQVDESGNAVKQADRSSPESS